MNDKYIRLPIMPSIIMPCMESINIYIAKEISYMSDLNPIAIRNIINHSLRTYRN